MADTMQDANKQDVKVTLHWLEKSRSQRIVWLLEACSIPYDLEIYKRQPNKLADPALKKVHPLGKSPVIEISGGDISEPIVLAESALICDYLASHFNPKLIPTRWQQGKEGKVGGETQQWMRYQYFLHYAEGSLMSLMIVKIVVDGIRNAPVPFFLKPIVRGVASNVDSFYTDPNFATHFDFLESQLASSPDGGEYLCGADLTAVDILMSFPMIAAKSRDLMDKEKTPKLWAYAEKLENEEGYVASVKKLEEETGETFSVL